MQYKSILQSAFLRHKFNWLLNNVTHTYLDTHTQASYIVIIQQIFAERINELGLVHFRVKDAT